jgi:hypothetical protein
LKRAVPERVRIDAEPIGNPGWPESDVHFIERRRREDRRDGHACYASAGRADDDAAAFAGCFRIDLTSSASRLGA